MKEYPEHVKSEDLTFEVFEFCLYINGDLEPAKMVSGNLETILKLMSKARRVRIEAAQARIVPEGITLWIELVVKYLLKTELVYGSSQLATILQFDERYKHSLSKFEDSLKNTGGSNGMGRVVG